MSANRTKHIDIHLLMHIEGLNYNIIDFYLYTLKTAKIAKLEFAH